MMSNMEQNNAKEGVCSVPDLGIPMDQVCSTDLSVGDHLLIKEFEKHHAYYAWEVIRGEENRGNYTAARFYGGIRSLFVKRAGK